MMLALSLRLLLPLFDVERCELIRIILVGTRLHTIAVLDGIDRVLLLRSLVHKKTVLKQSFFVKYLLELGHDYAACVR